jgi:DNA-binding NtrC family response regulator
MSDPIVVCVDDDPVLLAGVVRMLRNQGYELMATGDPIQALDWIGTKDVAVMVSDYEMPVMNGVELAAASRLVRPETVRVLMTGRQALDTAVAGINQGEVFRYVQKPFEPMVLRHVVREAVERHHELMANASSREQAKRRQQMATELDAEYPHITHVARDVDGAYVVPPTPSEAVAGVGIDTFVLIGRRP